jgi:hypothetical protein
MLIPGFCTSTRDHEASPKSRTRCPLNHGIEVRNFSEKNGVQQRTHFPPPSLKRDESKL